MLAAAAVAEGAQPCRDRQRPAFRWTLAAEAVGGHRNAHSLRKRQAEDGHDLDEFLGRLAASQARITFALLDGADTPVVAYITNLSQLA